MSNEEEEKKQGKFKVSDRRQFTSEGEIRSETEPSSPSEEGKPARPAEEQPSSILEDPASPPAVDFSSFLLSLATTAMVHLGEIPDPSTGKPEDNLDGAQQMIEILSILRQKTKGNLVPEETRLLDSLLYELRMKFMAKQK